MAETNKPDFRNGFPIRDLREGSMISGQADGEELVLARRGEEVFAIGAHCTHYGGPLGEGLIVGETVRCPWHHACFSLRTGEALRAPALDPVSCWRVERLGDKIFVREKVSAPAPKRGADAPSSVVIVGGGAAGLAAADMLRREGYDGPLTIVSADASPPVDRPNLSKDYLAGTAQEDWIPLRPSDHYRDRKIDLLLNSRVSSLDTKGRRIVLENGANRLLLPHDLPAKHHRWREKRNEDCRGRRFGYLASISTHFAEKVSRQSGICHCGVLARFSSHSESRLPLDLCRRAELKKMTRIVPAHQRPARCNRQRR